MRITESEYYALIRRAGTPPFPIMTTPPPKPSKYHAIITEADGIRFQSKREAAYYRELCCRVHAGEVLYFLRQVPLHLNGGVKYVCDFVEFWRDGSVHYVEVKGMETATWRIKKRLVESSYPIRIEVVK